MKWGLLLVGVLGSASTMTAGQIPSITPPTSTAGSTPGTFEDICKRIAVPLERELCLKYGLYGRESKQVAAVLSRSRSAPPDLIDRYWLGALAHQYAVLADAVYSQVPPGSDAGAPKPTPGWVLLDGTARHLVSGFGAATYVNMADSSIAVVYVGSDEAIDWAINVAALGLNDPQHVDAIRYFEEMRAQHPGSRIVIVGHSLGGRLAQLVAAYAGERAFTFNAAAPTAFANVMFRPRDGSHVLNFKVTSDLVSDLGRLVLMEDFGTNISFDFYRGDFITAPTASHGTRTFVRDLDGVKRLYQDRLLELDTGRRSIASVDRFVLLGMLPGPPGCWPTGVAANGRSVVGIGAVSDGLAAAFRWSPIGGMELLDARNGGPFFMRANAISADGSTVAGESVTFPAPYTTSSPQAVRWTRREGMIGIGYLDRQQSSSEANAVSADGSVIVGSSKTAVGTEAFRWTRDQGMVSLGYLQTTNSRQSRAIGVSGDGSVVVGNSEHEAFRWTSATGMVPIAGLTSERNGTKAHAVSADGTTIVGDTAQQAFRWTAATGVVGLGDLPGGAFYSRALAVSGNGAVVVGWGTSSEGAEALVWTQKDGMRRLVDLLRPTVPEMNGWKLRKATAISVDGHWIAGIAGRPGGSDEGFLARID